MSDNYERLRKWAKDAASGKTDKVPYIDITDLIDEVVTLRAAQPVVLTDEDKLFQIIRSFGYTTKGQTDEIVEAILAAKEQA